MKTNGVRTALWGAFGRLIITGWLVFALGMVPVYAAQNGDKQVVHLYFAHAKRPFLVAEDRVVVHTIDPLDLSRQLVMELIDGSSGGHLATIPGGTTLRSIFLLDDGTAVVDFSAEFRNNHPGSCRREQLTLFSVVNTLILNIPEIGRVKFLIDGEEAQTLAGHLPLAYPLTADMLLTR